MNSHFVCKLCNQSYNFQNRKPFIRSCCNETACKECLLQVNNGGNSSSCRICHRNIEGAHAGPNKALIQLYRENKRTVIVMCDEHPEVPA